MTIDTQKLRRIGALLDEGHQISSRSGVVTQAADTIDAQAAEIARLQRIIDSRPAINAGLPETYIIWSQSIYAMEAAHAAETRQ